MQCHQKQGYSLLQPLHRYEPSAESQISQMLGPKLTTVEPFGQEDVQRSRLRTDSDEIVFHWMHHDAFQGNHLEPDYESVHGGGMAGELCTRRRNI